jgi:hypothetical protein
MVQMEQTVRKVIKDQQVELAQQVELDQLDQLDHKVDKVQLVQLDQMVQMVELDQQVQLVQLETHSVVVHSQVVYLYKEQLLQLAILRRIHLTID